MSFIVVGINHRTAPVEVREKVAFAETDLAPALRALKQLPAVVESLIVSTCNRTELYCFTDEEHQSNAAASLTSWLADWHTVAEHHVKASVYHLTDEAAIRHAFAVASGLDSMMVGEAQILGQFKDAYRAAHEHHSAGPYLHRLFQAAFSAAKRVRTETRIGSNAVSVASAAVNLAKTVFDNLAQRTALLVGAGETIGLVARHLHANGVRRMIVCNRTLERAHALASEFDAFVAPLERLDAHLCEADIVIAATASPVTLISAAAVKAALKARKYRPMFMVDIAIPRDIDPAVGELADVYLFTLDHLQSMVADNMAARHQAATDAQQLLHEEVVHFSQHLRTLDAVPTIRQLRDDAESARAQTLEQARRMLNNGRNADEVLAFLADTLTHRLIHAPSHRLRQAGENGETDVIKAARELFAMQPPADK